MSDIEREAFEDAASRIGYSLKMRNPASEDGEYLYEETQDAWNLWQEKACSAGAVPEWVAETLVNDLFDIGKGAYGEVYRIQFMAGCLSDEKGCGGMGRGALSRWMKGRLNDLLTAAPTAPAVEGGKEAIVWLGNGDKLVADIYGADGSWAGVGIFQPTDGETHGIGEPDGRIDGQPVNNEIAYPLLSIRSHKPESLQVVIDELQESLDRMGYTHPHNGEQGGECKWTEDEGMWNSDCGYTLWYEDGTPSECGQKFCPKCGKPCLEVPNPPTEREGE